ncbi:MAG: carbohydrate binding domain-containing protein [Actinobacteria bacterium]|nr:carbohydrate binding domain-containing protein [Actinomycetota bacterium]
MSNSVVSPSRPNRARRLAAALAVLVASLLPTAALAPNAGASSATLTNGNGISVVSRVDSGRQINLTITTTDVQGTHQVIILLPPGYDTSGTTRYPVLYLLHGALAGPDSWVTNGGAADQITAGYPVITVIPDQGVKGWGMDWQNPGSLAPQKWESYTLDQLVPWIDANLRTIANRSGRAVAGLSMGGFAAMHYAEDRPDLFSYVASFSGALDLGNATTGFTILGEEIGIVPGSGTPVWPGAIMGGEVWPLNATAVQLAAVNPANIAHLANTTVALYVGTGDGSGPGIVEAAVKPQNDLMANRLWQAGVNYYYSQDHQPSPAYGWGCDNDHSQMCWNAYLADDMPRMMAVLAHPGGSITPPAPPSTPAFTDGGFESAGMGPWVCMGNCGVDHGLGNAHSGTSNGWVRNNNNAWNDIDQTVAVQPNTNYTLTGWVRTSSNAANGYFGARTTGGTVIAESKFGSVPGYTQLSVTFNSGPNTAVTIYGGEWCFGDTWIQIDDVALNQS